MSGVRDGHCHHASRYLLLSVKWHTNSRTSLNKTGAHTFFLVCYHNWTLLVFSCQLKKPHLNSANFIIRFNIIFFPVIQVAFRGTAGFDVSTMASFFSPRSCSLLPGRLPEAGQSKWKWALREAFKERGGKNGLFQREDEVRGCVKGQDNNHTDTLYI